MFLATHGILRSGSAEVIPYSNTKSMKFDGINDYLTGTSTYSELDGQSKASFSAWIKPTATNLLGVILHTPRNTGASDSQFQILIDNGNRLRFQVQDTGTYIFSNTGVFTANTWSHILVCYDGTLTSANRGKIFIDGVDQTSAVNMNTTSFPTSTSALYIGEHSQGFWNPFSGNIDELAIYNGTDLRDDVSTIYSNGTPTDLNNNGLTAPTTWLRMGDNASWDGTKWTMTDVNGGYQLESSSMVEADRTTDVP